MAKIAIGGELDPRTVEGILGDAHTIVDRTTFDSALKQDEVNAAFVEKLDSLDTKIDSYIISPVSPEDLQIYIDDDTLVINRAE